MSTTPLTRHQILTGKDTFTEYYPIRHIQMYREGSDDSVSNFLMKEVMTRVVGLSISFFAALDALSYLGGALCKTAALCFYKLNLAFYFQPFTLREDILPDLEDSFMFTVATLVGSIIGVVYPSILCPSSPTDSEASEMDEEEFDYESFGMTKEEYDEAVKVQRSFDLAKQKFESSNTPIDFDIEPGLIPEDLPLAWEETASCIQNLWNVANNVDSFKENWKTATTYDKRVFTHLLDIDTSDKGVAARANLVNIIYKKANSTDYDDTVSDEFQITSWPKQKEEAYYHATPSEDALEGILTSRKVEVRHEGAFKGAFVATTPETGFGKYVLVFNRNIERMADIEHRSCCANYWAGFKQDIPVNPQTVQKVLYNCYSNFYESDVSKCNKLAAKIKSWTGRDIPVEKYDAADFDDDKADHIIPREWEDSQYYTA